MVRSDVGRKQLPPAVGTYFVNGTQYEEASSIVHQVRTANEFRAFEMLSRGIRGEVFVAEPVVPLAVRRPAAVAVQPRPIRCERDQVGEGAGHVAFLSQVSLRPDRKGGLVHE